MFVSYLTINRGNVIMARSSREQIDRDEIKVIMELQKNCKDSLDKISKRCGFSRQKTWRIIKNIEKNKTVWGYHATIDNEKIDRKGFVLLIQWKHLPIENTLGEMIVKGTLDKSGAEMGVVVEDNFWVHGGMFDGIICFSAQNLKQAKRFQEIFINTYQEYIKDLQLLETMMTIKKDGFMNPKIKETKKLL
jgi:DNA-binding Lrp family transcriptional regulator